MAFETYKERLGLDGGNQSSAMTNGSLQILNQMFSGSTSCKTVFVDGVPYEARLIRDKDFSTATTRESWKIQVKDNITFPAGTYMNFDDKTWLVCKEEDALLFAKMYILECTYLLKWYDEETWELKEYWCPILPKNSYSPGVWANVFANFVDMETKIWLPNNYDTRKIVRDKRFIISNDDLNPTAYKITRRDSSILKGIMVLGLSEDEVSHSIDDLRENIADNGKYQIETVIDLPADYTISVRESESYQLQIQAYKLNKYNGLKKYAQAEEIRFTSSDTEIAAINGDIVTGMSEGTTSVLLEYGGECRQLTINVANDIEDVCELFVHGADIVYLGSSAKYDVITSLNGNNVNDEYSAEVLDIDCANISLLATAAMSGNQCVLKANSSNKLGYCVLRITSLNHALVLDKKIRIRSVL